MPEDRQKRLDRIAESYDSQTDFDFHLIQYNFRIMEPRLTGDACLEMGCASGVMTRLLLRRYAALDVVDGSAAYLEALQKELPGRVNCRQALFEDFEPSRKYDAVILARGLEHIADPVRLLARIRGWLRPERDAALHLVVPNADSLHRRLGVAMGLLERTTAMSERDRRYGHQRVYTFENLRRDVRAAGFRIVYETGIFLKPLSNAQMLAWDQKLLDGLFELGKQSPEWCAEIYFDCRP